MKILRIITYEGQDLLVVADEQGLLVENRETMKIYANGINETLGKLTDEAILDINKKLLNHIYIGEKNEESA